MNLLLISSICNDWVLNLEYLRDKSLIFQMLRPVFGKFLVFALADKCEALSETKFPNLIGAHTGKPLLGRLGEACSTVILTGSCDNIAFGNIIGDEFIKLMG